MLLPQFNCLPLETFKVKEFYEFILIDTNLIEIHRHNDSIGHGRMFSIAKTIKFLQLKTGIKSFINPRPLLDILPLKYIHIMIIWMPGTIIFILDLINTHGFFGSKRLICVNWWSKFDVSLVKKEKINEWIRMSQWKIGAEIQMKRHFYS
ncbi:hypothetical protein CR513_25843, partial [Mucuna pruriens]